MPPQKKVHHKKSKPLTPLERKALKKKQELIKKAAVKSQYYKTLAKEHADDTPDYVKEIFEKTIDEDGNVIEYESGTAKREKAEIREEKHKERPVNNSEDSSEKKDDEPKKKRRKENDNTTTTTKSHKPNPFKTQIDEQQKKKREKQEEREARQNEMEAKLAERKRYYQHRNKQRGKMLAKNKNGQPNLATQMEILLGRIKKD